jgi:hypothetical protein
LACKCSLLGVTSGLRFDPIYMGNLAPIFGGRARHLTLD